MHIHNIISTWSMCSQANSDGISLAVPHHTECVAGLPAQLLFSGLPVAHVDLTGPSLATERLVSLQAAPSYSMLQLLAATPGFHTRRTRMRSTCCKVKSPASQRSRKSCSSVRVGRIARLTHDIPFSAHHPIIIHYSD